MAACPRSHIVATGKIGVYHCWNRCVRRAFLCGFDRVTKKDYNYRRGWVRKLEQQLARLFAIDIAFHAEMQNHIHLILRTRPDIAATWSDEEVVKRWLQIAQLKRGCREEPTEPTQARIKAEMAKKGRVAKLRRRLSDVSWFMGALCENIARRSNIEDGCRGKFWESRFSCRDLASESAILICGIYVDLNPIRAGEARVAAEARYTSAFDRIAGHALRQGTVGQAGSSLTSSADKSNAETMPPDGWLCELTLASGPNVDLKTGMRSETPWRASDKGIVSLTLDEYLKLLDWTGRNVAAKERGTIPAEVAPILDRLSIHQSAWLDTVERFDKKFGHIVASSAGIKQKAAETGHRWLRGLSAAAEIFRSDPA